MLERFVGHEAQHLLGPGPEPVVQKILRRARSYYSDQEFDLVRLLYLRPRMVEPGRSCVHSAHRGGAVTCGEPAWDRDFNTADLAILLPMKNLSPVYARHFLTR